MMVTDVHGRQGRVSQTVPQRGEKRKEKDEEEERNRRGRSGVFSLIYLNRRPNATYSVTNLKELRAHIS